MEHYADRQGIFFLEPYDPGKIPVLMVHGILSSPLELGEIARHVVRPKRDFQRTSSANQTW
jgi:hypothetical protein